MRGNASGGAAHSFPEASTLPGVPQREGDSQRHLSGCFFFFSWSEEEELWDDWEEGWGAGGGSGGGHSLVCLGTRPVKTIWECFQYCFSIYCSLAFLSAAKVWIVTVWLRPGWSCFPVNCLAEAPCLLTLITYRQACCCGGRVGLVGGRVWCRGYCSQQWKVKYGKGGKFRYLC